jgi:ribosomal protein S27E
MDRKYRQRGYQDSGLEHEPRPKPAPRQKGAANRVETRFHLITRCNNCAAEIQVSGQIQMTEKCRNCGTDLHTCRNCLNFDPSARNECIKPVEVRVTKKSDNNLCEVFEPKILVEKQGSGAPTVKPVESHRQAFLDLFKKT